VDGPVATAFSLIASGDAALVQIIGLSLRVTLTAVVIACAIGLPLGAALALARFPGRGRGDRAFNALMGLPPVVAGLVVYLALSRSGPLGRAGASVHADGDDHRADDPDPAHRRLADPLGGRGPLGGVPRAVAQPGREPPARGADAAVGRAGVAADRRAGRVRPRLGRGRRGADRRRQHRRPHAHDDHRHHARDRARQPRAGGGAGDHPDGADADAQRAAWGAGQWARGRLG
jgi:hypothetical protein